MILASARKTKKNRGPKNGKKLVVKSEFETVPKEKKKEKIWDIVTKNFICRAPKSHMRDAHQIDGNNRRKKMFISPLSGIVSL